MNNRQLASWARLLALAAFLLTGCGQDRSGEYYALVGPKTWIYETMQQDYLFYDEVPEVTDNKTFFRKPSEFLQQLVSKKDQKNGVYFSHVDSVFTPTSRALSTYPSFGFEGVLVRTSSGDYAIQVVYTQPESPATQAGLKRGDWIIAANNRKIASDSYTKYVSRPAESYAFTLGQYTGGTGFDTLRTVQMPAPTYVNEQNLLRTQVLQSGNRKAGYVVYNEFGTDDAEQWKAVLQQLTAQGIDDLIIDLRYNPGGYVTTACQLGSLLAPASCKGQPFLKMTYNDRLQRTDVLPFEESGYHPDYENLYLLTSGNTASAAEILINCLRPYMDGRLFQVGEATFGKNLAQSLYTHEDYPQLELWLTTCSLSNAEDFMDYYEAGLPADYSARESLEAPLPAFGDAADPLLSPVLIRMATGSFPTSGEATPDVQTVQTRAAAAWKVAVHPMDHRLKNAKL